MSRRKFVSIMASGAIATTSWARGLDTFQVHKNNFRAITFDAFAIFDYGFVPQLAEKIVAGRGIELANLWRIKQFEYCWLRTSGGRYQDFWSVTEDALIFAINKLNIHLSMEELDTLMKSYLALSLWPDVNKALKSMREQGISISILSNMTTEMLHSNLQHNGLQNYFHHIISTDQARTYKPSPSAYQLGVDLLKFKKEEILFVPSAGWDATGAKWFGYPTFWVNRQGTPSEQLDAFADAIGSNLSDLDEFVRQ